MAADFSQSLQALCSALQLQGDVGYPEVKAAFIKKIVDIARVAADDLDEAHIKSSIESLCELFFPYCNNWYEYLAEASAKKGAQPKDHAEASRLKTEAGAIIRGLQLVISQVAGCEGVLFAVGKIIDNDIQKALSEGCTQESGAAAKWSYDLPQQVALMAKKRDALSTYMVRVRRAKPVVEKLEFAYGALEKGLESLLGHDRSKKSVDDFTGMLRKHLYAEAEKYLREIERKDMKKMIRFDRKERQKKWNMIFEISDLIVACVKKCEKRLMGRGGRVFLRLWEINLAYESMTAELEQARDFLSKNTLPEVRYRREALDRQSASLHNITNLEAMIGLYEDLLKGRLLPMATLKDVKGFEEGTLKKVHFTLRTLSKDIENIEAAALKLAQGPDPESIPDDKLFENIEDVTAQSASA